MKQLARRLLIGLLIVIALPAVWLLWGWSQMRAEHDRLFGVWNLESMEYGREVSRTDEGDAEVWLIQADQASRYFNGRGVNTFEFKLRPNEDPKQIDLNPIVIEPTNPAAVLAPVAGLYSIQDDTLQIATTFHFVPGSPEEERQRAIEAGKVRPASFDTRSGDVAVMTFRRKKDGARP